MKIYIKQDAALLFVLAIITLSNCGISLTTNLKICQKLENHASPLKKAPPYNKMKTCQWDTCGMKVHDANRIELTCVVQDMLNEQKRMLQQLQNMTVGGPHPLYGGSAQLLLGRLQLPAALRQLTDRLLTLQLQPQPVRGRHARRVASLLDELWPSGGRGDGWDRAVKSKTRKELFEPWAGLGDTLVAMATGRIVGADVATVGSQLKLLLTLEGNHQILFKPQWYRRDRPVRGGLLSGRDRPHAELAGWHLLRLLGVQRAPLVTARALRLDAEVRPAASGRLRRTMSRRGSRSCVFGECRYCSPERPVCTDDSGVLPGAAILWLPGGAPLRSHPHPWRRTYSSGQPARWEQEPDFCPRVRSWLSPGRLLDLVDAAVFDFLIQNGDRHHYETLGRGGLLVLIDNGKSFGDPDADHFDILAPLFQCCSIRRRTWRVLEDIPAGQLGALLAVTAADALGPLLTEPHLGALSRRHRVVLETVRWCLHHSPPGHTVLVED